MQYIEAPNDEIAKYKSVFLAGGISNCPDWQKTISQSLTDLDVTVLNPRREHYPDHVDAATIQITWEFHKLREADIISFWFSEGSLNPIVLFEFGAALERKQQLVVGVSPSYQRSQDVHIQTKLKRPDIKIASSIDEMIVSIRSLLK